MENSSGREMNLELDTKASMTLKVSKFFRTLKFGKQSRFALVVYRHRRRSRRRCFLRTGFRKENLVSRKRKREKEKHSSEGKISVHLRSLNPFALIDSSK